LKTLESTGVLIQANLADSDISKTIFGGERYRSDRQVRIGMQWMIPWPL